MSDFKRLKVWAKAHALALRTYAVTKEFPREELYGLTSQMRRAAVSIGSNLAEGCGRETRKEMAYFLRIAIGSTQELRYQLMLAADLGWLLRPQSDELEREVEEVRAMLNGLRVSLGGDRER